MMIIYIYICIFNNNITMMIVLWIGSADMSSLPQVMAVEILALCVDADAAWLKRVMSLLENHRKTIGKWWLNGVLMGLTIWS